MTSACMIQLKVSWLEILRVVEKYTFWMADSVIVSFMTEKERTKVEWIPNVVVLLVNFLRMFKTLPVIFQIILV